MGRITSYFGLRDAKPEVVRLATIYTSLSLFMQIAFVISTTFYLIFVAEALGNNDFILGMTFVGILVIIQMAVQTLFDYPTGVIGDWLGQRYILATAFLTYSIAFFLVSTVTTTSPFILLVLIYALILKMNPADVCALNKGDARAFVNVTINRAYTIDLEALAGHGNMNLTANGAMFDNIYFHHGINCPGNNGMNITDSVVYEDLTCQVATGNFWVRLDNVDIRGTLDCTPADRGTLIEI